MCSLESGFKRPGIVFRKVESMALVAYEEEVEDKNLGLIVEVLKIL